jgi:hypothetical protein
MSKELTKIWDLVSDEMVQRGGEAIQLLYFENFKAESPVNLSFNLSIFTGQTLTLSNIPPAFADILTEEAVINILNAPDLEARQRKRRRYLAMKRMLQLFPDFIDLQQYLLAPLIGEVPNGADSAQLDRILVFLNTDLEAKGFKK